MTSVTPKQLPRIWSPYELTQLRRAGIDPSTLAATDTRPVEYITGQADFCGWHVLVTPDVLIPRVETEQLVAWVVADLHSDPPSSRQTLVDVGTGSGAIGLSIWLQAQHHQWPLSTILVDISSSALAQAHVNATRLQQTHPSSPNTPVPIVQQGDLLASFAPHSVDVVVANLPYIPTSHMAHVPPSVYQHEPRLALDGGADGLSLIGRLLDQATTVVKPNGSVYLEVDDSHTPDVFSAWLHRQPHAQTWESPHWKSDYRDVPRFIRLKKRTLNAYRPSSPSIKTWPSNPVASCC